MIGLPGIERGVNRCLIMEIAIAPIDRQLRCRDRHQDGARSAPDDFVMPAGGDHDHFMAEPGRGAELALNIGADSAAARRVKSATVGDPHSRLETGRPSELQVKLCSWVL